MSALSAMEAYRALVERALAEYLPEPPSAAEVPALGEMPAQLLRGMRYSLLSGGKRLRPCMLLAAADMLGADRAEALPLACALEMIHTYSLIHDDLPGMDDDAMRRGRPTNHVVFGVGQAILAGDGLLTMAFEIMLENALKYPNRAVRHLRAIGEIARAAGVRGMVAGQVMDLQCEGEGVSDEQALAYIQENKTARLFVAPLAAAGCLSGADEAAMDALRAFGRAFGLLFQATDDILDVVGDPALLGKGVGKDQEKGKLTCVARYGLDGARHLADDLALEAGRALARFGPSAGFFLELACDMAHRAS